MRIKQYIPILIVCIGLCGCSTQARAYDSDAMKLYQEKKYEQAEELFLEATVLEHTNATYFTHLGMNYIELNELEKALQAFDDSIRIKPAQKLAYRGKGIVKLLQKDYDAAISYFKEAISHTGMLVDETDFDILAYRAKAEELGGFFMEAIATYSALIELNYHKEEMLFHRGSIYLKLQDAENALQDFKKCTELAPDDTKRFFEIYDVLEKAGHAEKGTAYLNMILNRSDESEQGHVNRGKVYYILGKYSNAKTELSKASVKEYPEIILYLGLCQENLGQYEEAMETYASFLKSYNRTSKYEQAIYAQYAYTAAQLGDYSLAKQLIEKAIACGESNISQELLWNQIMICAKLQDYATALNLAAAYREKYPDDHRMDAEIAFYTMLQMGVADVMSK